MFNPINTLEGLHKTAKGTLQGSFVETLQYRKTPERIFHLKCLPLDFARGQLLLDHGRVLGAAVQG